MEKRMHDNDYWLALSSYSKNVRFLGQNVSVWSLNVIPLFVLDLSGYSGFLPLSKNMQTGG